MVQIPRFKSRYALPSMKIRYALILFLCGFAIFASVCNGSPRGRLEFKAAGINGVVYSRVPRTVPSDITAGQFSAERITIDGKKYKNFDFIDLLSETGYEDDVMQVFNGPGQLIYLDDKGKNHILFDCMNAPIPCVPLDAMVDFSGNKVIFSVYYGELQPLQAHGIDLPNTVLYSTHAQLHIVDLKTFNVTPISQPKGIYDTGPVWLPDGRIMFTSTRSKEFGTTVRWHSPLDNHVLQLWISDADGSNAYNISPHERDHALHPYVLSSGRVIYSTWQLNHQLPFRDNNGAPNSFGTTRNFFWVASIDLRGGDFHSLLGAHNGHVKNDGLEGIQALHFLGERTNGDICTSNYYAGNNLGSGTILCWTPEKLGVEGWGPAEVPGSDYDEGGRLVFSPRNLYSALPFGSSNDYESKRDERSGEFLGKVRDPDGLPDGNLLLAYGRGRCSHAHDLIFDVQQDKVGCDFGIYATAAPQSNGIRSVSGSSFRTSV